MNNPFSGPKIFHKLHFLACYKHLQAFEDFFPEDTLGISTYEVESKTIEAEPDDIWSVEVYFAENPGLAKTKEVLNKYAKEHNLKIKGEITLEQVEDKDWVTEYQKQLKPIEVGSFVITQKGIELPAGKTPIYISASRAFGTGEHATTALCAEALESLKDKQMRSIFDLGTGSGVLSFVAEKIWPNAEITASDIDEVAVEVAKENLHLNNSKVRFFQNTESLSELEATKFDLIVSNILAGPLISFAPKIKKQSASGAYVILSGFLDYQADEVLAAYEKVGFDLVKKLQRDNWVTLALKVNAR